jgi:hypothetical protein
MAAVFGNEVALLKMEHDGSYSPIERYGFAAARIVARSEGFQEVCN